MGMSSAFGGIFAKKAAVSAKITNINIAWKGKFHSLNGMEAKDRTFKVMIPFTNASEVTELVKDFLKANEEPAVISSITVDKPFELIDINPKTPISLKANEKVQFELSIRAPEQSYTGPMLVRFVGEEKPKVRIEINKVLLSAKGRTVEVEKSSMIFESGKGQLFRNVVQMYKVLSFGDSVRSVTVSKPFRFVSSDPKLPFKIDNENSFIATFYIQAPEASYAGPMELSFD